MDEKTLLARIDDALAKGAKTLASQKSVAQQSRIDPRNTKVVGWVDVALAAEFRAAGGSLLRDMVGGSDPFYSDFMAHTSNNGQPFRYQAAVGILRVVREQVQQGWLVRTRGLIAGEVFSDFLEMAQHLLDEGYKDAAAVIAGSSLEAHLKRMCGAAGIASENTNAKGALVPKKADALNAELAGASAYNKTEMKQVTAWLGVRNDAAHGDYQKVLSEMVRLMIAGIRDFTVRHPA